MECLPGSDATGWNFCVGTCVWCVMVVYNQSTNLTLTEHAYYTHRLPSQ